MVGAGRTPRTNRVGHLPRTSEDLCDVSSLSRGLPTFSSIVAVL